MSVDLLLKRTIIVLPVQDGEVERKWNRGTRKLVTEFYRTPSPIGRVRMIPDRRGDPVEPEPRG